MALERANLITEVAAGFAFDGTILALDGSTVKSIQGNIKRWSLIFSNRGPDDARVFLKPDVTTLQPLLILPANRNPVQLTFADHGPLIQQDWFAVSEGTASTLSVFTVYKVN